MLGMRSRDGGFKLPSTGKFTSFKMTPPRDRTADAWRAAEDLVDRALPQLKSERPRGADGRFVAAAPPPTQRTMGGIDGNIPGWLIKARPLPMLLG
jgi:hypothetical protein